jgi:hypothetical protein
MALQVIRARPAWLAVRWKMRMRSDFGLPIGAEHAHYPSVSSTA